MCPAILCIKHGLFLNHLVVKLHIVQNPSCLCLSLHSQLCVDLPNQNEKSYMIKRVCFCEYEGVAYFSWY
jgi:hypothetical protein